MSRPLIILIISGLLISCNSKSQSQIDVHTSLRLFKEGSELSLKGYFQELEEKYDSSKKTDSISSGIYNRQAIQTFLLACKADPTNKELGVYLSELYYRVQSYDSALQWALALLPVDSMKYAANHPTSFASSLAHLGFCYLSLGELEMGRYYLQRANALDGRNYLPENLADFADQIYHKKSPVRISHLVSKGISPCEYVIDIMDIGRTLGKGNTYVEEILLSPAKFEDRKKNCR